MPNRKNRQSDHLEKQMFRHKMQINRENPTAPFILRTTLALFSQKCFVFFLKRPNRIFVCRNIRQYVGISCKVFFNCKIRRDISFCPFFVHSFFKLENDIQLKVNASGRIENIVSRHRFAWLFPATNGEKSVSSNQSLGVDININTAFWESQLKSNQKENALNKNENTLTHRNPIAKCEWWQFVLDFCVMPTRKICYNVITFLPARQLNVYDTVFGTSHIHINHLLFIYG